MTADLVPAPTPDRCRAIVEELEARTVDVDAALHLDDPSPLAADESLVGTGVTDSGTSEPPD